MTEIRLHRWAFPVGLALLAGLLVATAVRGAYIVDENNYLATLVSLRGGGLSVPGTAGLTPSAELYWFDPLALSRVARTPLVSSAPPLWAPLALPFSLFGWYGLVALNALALMATAWLVHGLARRLCESRTPPRIAVVAVLLGGYSLEYAQGVWPHCLTVALCTGGLVLAARARLQSAARFPWPALASGVMVGLATGVRYQNIVFAASLGLGLLLLGKRRFLTAALFAIGVAGPLLASAALNRARLGWWNPVSKGPGYVSLATPAEGHAGRASELGRVLYAKVVDFATHPPMGGGASARGADRWRWEPSRELHAYIVHGAVKKALLQSAPWLSMSLPLLALAWRRRRSPRAHPPAADDPRAAAEQARVDELRALGIVLGGVLLLFGLSGFGRQDGLCANQRYLLELVPVAALALALGFDRLDLPRPALLAGAAAAGLIALVVLWPDGDPQLRVRGLRFIPLVLAAAGAGAVLALRLGLDHLRVLPAALAALTGAGLTWAAAVHLGDDLPAAYRRRLDAAALAERWDAVLPPRAALFVHFAGRDASAPLHLGRDLLLVDPWLDSARDAPRVADELLLSGRRVFIDTALVPPPITQRIRARHPTRIVLPGEKPLLELLP